MVTPTSERRSQARRRAEPARVTGRQALVLAPEVERHGGVQYATRLMLRALADALGPDCRIALVTVNDRAVDVARLGVPCRVWGGGGRRLRTGVAALGELLRRRWDVVFLAHLNLGGLTWLGSWVRPQPLLAVVYGIEGWAAVGGLRRRGLRQARKVLYISEHSRVRSQEANPWLASVAGAVCHLGLLPVATSGPLVGLSGLTSGPLVATGDAPFALMVGRLARGERYKGHDEMIRVWPEVRRHRPDLRLAIAGDGDDRARLEALARDTGGGVTFLGAVDDAARDRLLRQCRCFCLPSRGEGFGLVYLEAMREGKPVLAGSGDAGREVVHDRVTGRTVDPASPAELLDGVLDVSGPRAEEYGRAGRRRFLEQFDYEHFARRFGEQVRGVLADR